ncbi:hypothetical protein IC582_007342 [Cucumis melo]|uniref:AAA-ATPase At3g50940-like n=2 Tax=Cucumis melo TaxID=3656 RepID=A0A1S3CSS5_CUCME|nr:AAA-ATPase At3g50940-like [Cucumis melo]KAA0041552.1 AAA-ATPase [Cucumis melo var. makuwa]TYK19702.1 AAA-ATPase [Cucumis melo var. makuwa]
MMASPQESLPSPKTILSVVASLTASAVLFRTFYNELIPDAVRDYFVSRLHDFSTRFSSQLIIVIEELDGLTVNQMFDAANVYLGTKLSSSSRRIKVHKPQKEKELAVTIDRNQEIIDIFQGVNFKWVLVSSRIERPTSSKNRDANAHERSDVRHFELSFHQKHREMALRFYLPHILREANAIGDEKKAVKLHTIDYSGTDYWGSIDLNHPATFDTIAMNPETKKALIDDLNTFIERKEYYKRVGRAWKRGYLLYGPPGTGKSSLVAAVANYLKFDIYDMDLREVQCNSDLRRLLIGTGNRSILVIEDIDCSIELQDRSSDSENQTKSTEDEKITLSGLLNFIDGLWSSCGDERIVILTTNHMDRLDPALLRPGRMDMHLPMSYCDFSGFKILAYNYLLIQEHPLFEKIEELLNKVEATPAELAGELMKSDDAASSLQGIIQFLHDKQEKTRLPDVRINSGKA